jgi:Fur family peroxide stress response transcriptional regulator
MPLSPEEGERRLQMLSAGIREAGLRLTHQRLEIMREIAGNDAHPDVERVYCGVRQRVPTISLDTVYRTLSKLAEIGLITRLTATAGPARYDGNPFRHHHFVCTRCGLVRDIEDAELDALRPTVSTETLGRLESVQVEFRGVCPACQQAPPKGDDHPVREKGVDDD